MKGRRTHTFICGATHCCGTSRHVRRFLDTKDAKSTSNLRRHALKCWGEDNVDAAHSRPADEVHEATKGGSVSGSIMAAFKWKGKGKVHYSHRQHTRTETRYVYKLTRGKSVTQWNVLNRAEIVRWVAESSRLLNIVKDRRFQNLMKTGRPEYWLPSPSMSAHDVKLVFAKTRNRIARILKVRQRYHLTMWNLHIIRNTPEPSVLLQMHGPLQTIRHTLRLRSTSSKMVFRFQCCLILSRSLAPIPAWTSQRCFETFWKILVYLRRLSITNLAAVE